MTKAATGVGYVQIWRDGKYVLAHRAALEHKLGRPIKEGLQACHSCHNKRCVNPDHLREDTAKNNIADRQRAMRHAYGEKVGNSKLKEFQVREIKYDKRPEKILAEIYGISANVVGEIRRGRIWKHIK